MTSNESFAPMTGPGSPGEGEIVPGDEELRPGTGGLGGGARDGGPFGIGTYS